MFHHQGPGRSDAQNRMLAGYLAFVGGFVNCASLMLIGAFTSHVTGNVGRLGRDLAFAQYSAAFAALWMIGAFFAGAFLASMAIESSVFGRVANAYAFALVTEAALLIFFMATSDLRASAPARQMDMEAAVLCAAMGMQNSLVTRLSGAVVRTTHLTGVVTDLGIEGARWFRWWRGRLAAKLHFPLAFGRNPPEQPARDKSLLLLTISVTFGVGAVLGAGLAVRMPNEVMAVPIVALLGCGLYAFVGGRTAAHPDDAPRTRR